MRALVAGIALLASCSNNAAKSADAATHDDAKVIDAKIFDAHVDSPPPLPDASTSVITVVCPVTPDQTVMTGADVYSPMTTTITVGQIVKFVMPSFHNVQPNSGVDPGVHVDFSQSECKQFTVAGTFPFHCAIHGFMGSVVVN